MFFFIGDAIEHRWVRESLTVYITHPQLPALCYKIQSGSDSPMAYLHDHSLTVWNEQTEQKLRQTSMLYRISNNNRKCRVINRSEYVTKFENRATFLILEQPVPPEVFHSGLLFTCGNCFQGNSRKKNISLEIPPINPINPI